MRLVCPNCDAEYEVDDAAIPRAGRDVQCSNCGHAWFQTHPEVAAEQAAQAARVKAPAAVTPVAAPPAAAPPAAARVAPPTPAARPTAAASTPIPPAPPSPEPEDVLAAAEPDYDPDYDLEYGPEEMPGEDMALAAPPLPELEAEAWPDPAKPASPDLAPDLVPGAGMAPPPAAVPDAASNVVTIRTEPMPARNIDESILAVLREEAAREAAARRAEAPPVLETQTEMPLDPAASRRAARLQADTSPRTAPAAAPTAPAAAPASVVGPASAELGPVEAAPVDPARPRRDLLPAIEEINSTLRATSERGYDEANFGEMEAAGPRKGGFRTGFLTLVLFGVILLALYVFAPLIEAKVPALAGAAASYVAAVDAARIWVDSQIRSLIGMLRGMEGASQG